MKIKYLPKFTMVFASLVLAIGFGSASAYALSLTPSDATATSTDNSNCEPTCVGFPALQSGSTLLYKADVGDLNNPATTESGSFADSYMTTFANSPLDPQDATITYDGLPDPSITCPFCYLIVKDGNATPAQYFFDISNLWNGTDTISLTGFWPNNGAISHVSIWGVPGTTDGGVDGGTTGGEVPEPGTILLLGTGLAGLGVWRLKKKK